MVLYPRINVTPFPNVDDPLFNTRGVEFSGTVYRKNSFISSIFSVVLNNYTTLLTKPADPDPGGVDMRTFD